MSESVELPESWGITARELCDHFAAWVRGELPIVGDVSVNVRLPTKFQQRMLGLEDAPEQKEGSSYLMGINMKVRDDGSPELAGVLNRWRGYVWSTPGLGARIWSGGFKLTSRSGERFSIDLISAHRLYSDGVSTPSAVIVLQVHHIPRPLVPVVERCQQLGGGGFDDIQHALGKMEGRR